VPAKKPKPRPSSRPDLPAKHRRQRERAYWEWALDLSDVRTEAQFVALIKEHFRERVRVGFIREFRVQAGARFWAQVNWELACYFGDIRVRVHDWAGFQQRLPAVAKRLQANFRQLRGECGPGFRVEYGSTPTTGVRLRTYIRYVFLGPKCKLTIPALTTAIRKVKWEPPMTVIGRTWSGLEFHCGLETRTLPKVAGLDVQQGGRRLHFALNANAKRVGQLLAYLTDIGTHNVPDELDGCRRVLEVWSEEDDSEGALAAHWQPLVQLITDKFPGAVVEPDDPLQSGNG
jgi:hypothetical protein